MELNRDDYCDECWLIVSSENQVVPPNEADTTLTENVPTTVLSDHTQRASVTEETPTNVLSEHPQRVSTSEEAPSTVLSSIHTTISGTGEAPGTICRGSFEKSKIAENEDTHSPLYAEPPFTTSESTVKRTRKSGTTLNDVDVGSSKRTKVRESPSGFTALVLSSTSEFLEGARPNDSDLCLECLVDEYHNVFDQNVLKNVYGSGTDLHECKMVPIPKRQPGRYIQVCSDPFCPRFKFWKVLDAGGAGWKVDTSSEGRFPPVKDVNEFSCFVTSNGLCSKEQLVELSQVGLCPRIMDEVRPEIEVSEWFCGQSNCSSRYGFKVSLLDSNKLMKYVYGECKTLEPPAPESLEWRKVTHTFRDYDPGVRYVLFHHGGQGKDFQGSDGEGTTHPGSKMAGASIVVKRPIML